MTQLNDLMGLTKNTYATIANDGIDWSDVSGWVDTGSYMLNALLSGSIYGGLADNKRLAIGGSTSTGKTFAALTMVKLFLEQHKDSYVAYFDSECAITKDMFIDRGINAKRVAVFDVSTLEALRFQVNAMVDGYLKLPKSKRKRFMIVVDSLSQISNEREMQTVEDGKNKADMGNTQKLIKSMFRTISSKMGRAHIPMIITAHTYKEMGAMYAREILAGGTGLAYSGDMIVFLSKSKVKDGTDVVGNNIRCTLAKGRFTKENKQVRIGLRYDTGLQRYDGLLDLAEKYGIVTKLSNKFKFKGEPEDSKGAFEKHIYKKPEKYFTKEILDEIDKAAAQEFLYGSALEEETIDE